MIEGGINMFAPKLRMYTVYEQNGEETLVETLITPHDLLQALEDNPRGSLSPYDFPNFKRGDGRGTYHDRIWRFSNRLALQTREGGWWIKICLEGFELTPFKEP